MCFKRATGTIHYGTSKGPNQSPKGLKPPFIPEERNRYDNLLREKPVTPEPQGGSITLQIKERTSGVSSVTLEVPREKLLQNPRRDEIPQKVRKFRPLQVWSYSLFRNIWTISSSTCGGNIPIQKFRMDILIQTVRVRIHSRALGRHNPVSNFKN